MKTSTSTSQLQDRGEPLTAEISTARGLSKVISTVNRFDKLVNATEREDREKEVPRLVAPLSGLSIAIGSSTYRLGDFLGAGAAGFVLSAVDKASRSPVALKFSRPFVLEEGQSLWKADFLKDSPGHNLRTEIKALEAVRKNNIPDTQRIISAALIRNPKDGHVIGVVVSELSHGVKLSDLDQRFAEGGLSIETLGEAYSRLVLVAKNLSNVGIRVDDLAPDNCLAQISPSGTLTTFSVLDFGSAHFCGKGEDERNYALQENLETIRHILRRFEETAVKDSPAGNRMEYFSDELNDFIDERISQDELMENLKKYEIR